jgi:hypothetical protein
MNCQKSLEKGTMKLVIIYCEGGAIYVSVPSLKSFVEKQLILNYDQI